MKNDLLTLVREIEILREENLKKQGYIDELKKQKGFFQEMSKEFHGSITFFDFLSNANSVHISDKGKHLVTAYNNIRERYGRSIFKSKYNK